jgi:NAD(P)-dependent dehydrogenase (short-subunit alcohol dehydrogenase family)
MSAASAADARIVVLTQEHRGQGVSTAMFYLAQALARQGVRVLVADLSLRRSPLVALFQHAPLKNTALWAPGAIAPEQLGGVLEQAKAQVAGKVDCMLVDVDALPLVRAHEAGMPMDFLVLAAGNTAEGRQVASRLAERVFSEEPVLRQAGVLFMRVPAQDESELEPQLEKGLAVLGSLPADYLLATREEYVLKGAAPPQPHEAYLAAILRTAVTLIRLVPLKRGVSKVFSDS